MDDYYQIAGVDRTAPGEEIDRATRRQLRRWQQRTATADLDRRQEAERRVRQLSEARTNLLDEEKRQQYDRRLAEFRRSPPLPATGEEAARRRRFGTLPGPVPPADWTEEVGEDNARAQFEPPADIWIGREG